MRPTEKEACCSERLKPPPVTDAPSRDSSSGFCKPAVGKPRSKSLSTERAIIVFGSRGAELISHATVTNWVGAAAAAVVAAPAFADNRGQYTLAEKEEFAREMKSLDKAAAMKKADEASAKPLQPSYYNPNGNNVLAIKGSEGVNMRKPSDPNGSATPLSTHEAATQSTWS